MTFSLLALTEARDELEDSEARLRRVQDSPNVVDVEAHQALQIRVMRSILRLREQVRRMEKAA